VERFHADLENRLAQLLGEPLSVWRDPKLRGNETIDDSIRKHIYQAAILLAILSPRYLKSESCRFELEEFFRAVDSQERIVPEELERVLKVIKTPAPRSDEPVRLKSALGRPFFSVDPQTGRAVEFSRDQDEYWDVFEDVAQDLADTLRALKEGPRDDTASEGERAFVYLAETTSDFSEDREKLRRELVHRGYRVLPRLGAPLPLSSGDECLQAARSMLEKCRIVVHFVGDHYGIVPESSRLSIAELQLIASQELATDSTLQRVIWMKPGIDPTDDRQRAFVDSINGGKPEAASAEVVTANIEKVKELLLKLLDTEPVREPPPAAERSVYLMCTERDFEPARITGDALFEMGFEVNYPAFEGDEWELLEDHQYNMVSCDGWMIYHKSGSEPWLRGKLRDDKKAPGYGRKKGAIAKAILYRGDRASQHISRIRPHEIFLIEAGDRVPSEQIEPFVSRVNQLVSGVA
jgi:hypothetical protein